MDPLSIEVMPVVERPELKQDFPGQLFIMFKVGFRTKLPIDEIDPIQTVKDLCLSGETATEIIRQLELFKQLRRIEIDSPPA